MKAQTFAIKVDGWTDELLPGRRVQFAGCEHTFRIEEAHSHDRTLVLTGIRSLPVGVVRGKASCPDMPIETYISTLPMRHRDAVERMRSGAPTTPEDGDLFLKVVYWTTWAPMSEDDKDRFTLELLAATRTAKAWDAAR